MLKIRVATVPKLPALSKLLKFLQFLFHTRRSTLQTFPIFHAAF